MAKSKAANCAKSLHKEYRGRLNKGELDEIVADLESAFGPEKSLTDVDPAHILEGALDKVRENVAVDRRNRLFNAYNRQKVSQQIDDMVNRKQVKDEVDGILGMIEGKANRAERSALSIASTKHVEWEEGLWSGLRQIDETTWNDFRHARNHDDIRRAIYAERNPDAVAGDTAAPIRAFAKEIIKYQDAIVNDLNLHGAWIGRLDDYITGQSHVAPKIRAAPPDEWKGDFLKEVDWKRTFGDTEGNIRNNPDALKDVEAVLDRWYADFATGNHMKALYDDNVLLGKRATEGGPSNAARSVSQQRKIHFKDAESQIRYGEKYGEPNLMDSLSAHMQRSARTAGILRQFGPNYVDNINRVMADKIEAAKARGDVEGAKRISESTDRINRAINDMDGSNDIPGNEMVAQWSSIVRSNNNLSKLGGAMWSTATDSINIVANAARQGAPFSQAVSEYVSSIGDMAKRLGKTDAEKAGILADFGVAQNVLLSTRTDPFRANDVARGATTKTARLHKTWNWMNDKMMHISGLGPMSNASRSAAAMVHANHFGRMLGDSWENAPEGMKRALEISGVREDEWDFYRQFQSKQKEGDIETTIFQPSDIRKATDEQVADYLKKKERPVNKTSMEMARTELEDSYRNYIWESTMTAVSEAKPHTKNMMTQGTDPSSVPGVIFRQAWQFNSFAFSFLRNSLHRHMVHGSERGTFGAGGLLKSGKNWATPVIGQVLGATMVGYGVLAVKNMLRGKTAPAPGDFETWRDAMVQGGGMPILADFFMESATKEYGGNFITKTLGPTFDVASDMADIAGNLLTAETWVDGKSKAAMKVMRFLHNNAPGQNLWQTRWLTDYMLSYSLYENLDPGRFKRINDNVEEQTGSKTFFDPMGML